MNVTTKRSFGLLAAGVAAAGMSWGQESDAVGRSTMRTIEEVVITATRREQDSQTVPVSVNAFSASMLEERTVRDLGDLTKIAPGIRFVHQGGGGNMNVVMRGLARIPIGTAPNAVINYFADVPLSFQGSNIPTYDLASIQVLKGPQGTLFGRNAMAGAVVITPQAPSYEFGGYLRASAGNYDYRDYEGALNIPLLDDLVALRIAGKVSRRDGYTKSMGIGRDQDDVHQDMFRVSLLVEPSDTFSNSTVFDYLESDEGGTGSILVKALNSGLVRTPALASLWDCKTTNPLNPIPCTGFQPGRDVDDALIQQKQWGVRKTLSELDSHVYRELKGLSNRTEWQFGGVTIRNIIGYRTTELNTDLNTDGLAFDPPLINASARNNERQISDELHIFGKLLDDRMDYLVGGFYIKEEPNGKNGSLFTVASPVAPWVQAYTKKTNKAVFAQIGYDLSAVVDGVKFNAGYRYNETEQEVCATTSAATNIFITPYPQISERACPSSLRGSVVDASEYANTWNIGLDWQINDSIFSYITHRKGYREGGINAPAFNSPASLVLAPYQTYEPETLKDIEIGLKTDFAVGEMPVRFNIAAYRGKYDNVLTNFNAAAVVPASDPSAPLSNAVGINTGKRTLSGFETELMVELLDSLMVSNTTAYVHQKINELSLPPVPGLQGPSFDPASPKWATTVALRWVLPFQPLGGEVVFNADYYWQDAYFVGNAELPSYEVSNLRLDWNDFAGTGVDLGFFMRNVFDDEYPYAVSSTAAAIGVHTLSYAEPRMYGLQVNYRFGQ